MIQFIRRNNQSIAFISIFPRPQGSVDLPVVDVTMTQLIFPHIYNTHFHVVTPHFDQATFFETVVKFAGLNISYVQCQHFQHLSFDWPCVLRFSWIGANNKEANVDGYKYYQQTKVNTRKCVQFVTNSILQTPSSKHRRYSTNELFCIWEISQFSELWFVSFMFRTTDSALFLPFGFNFFWLKGFVEETWFVFARGTHSLLKLYLNEFW